MRHALNILLGICLFAPAASALTPAPSIPGFHPVNAHLFRGGRPDDAGLAQLAALGVHTVIDLQGGDADAWYGGAAGWLEPGELPENIAHEKSVVESLGMTFVSLPLNSFDTVDERETAEIEHALAIIADTGSQPVFVHCQHGVDRTGLVIALERVRLEHWTSGDAYAEWQALGHSGLQGDLTSALDEAFARMTKTRGLRLAN